MLPSFLTLTFLWLCWFLSYCPSLLCRCNLWWLNLFQYSVLVLLGFPHKHQSVGSCCTNTSPCVCLLATTAVKPKNLIRLTVRVKLLIWTVSGHCQTHPCIFIFTSFGCFWIQCWNIYSRICILHEYFYFLQLYPLTLPPLSFRFRCFFMCWVLRFMMFAP